jgi:hypothetical protein
MTTTSQETAGEEDSTRGEDPPSSPPPPSPPPSSSPPFNSSPAPPAVSASPPDGSREVNNPSRTDGEDENPFQTPSDSCSATPMPDLHSQRDNAGPSEHISWAFRRQGLDTPFDVDPPSSPLGAFGEETLSSSYRCPASPAGIRDNQIDPTLLQSSPVRSAPATDTNLVVNPAVSAPEPPVVNATSDPLAGFSTARPFVSAFLSGRSSMAAPIIAGVSATENASANSTPPSMSETPPTLPLTSPRRATASTIILTSLLPAPASSDPPQNSQNHPAVQPENNGIPSDDDLDSGLGEGSSEGQIQSRGRGRGGRGGRGRGGRGRGGRGRGGRGGQGGTPKENGLLSAASRRRIKALNSIVYPPDGAPVAPLGASLSINADGMYPCITFQAPPSAVVAPKKRSRDVVSEADIVQGKRARKERVRNN